MSEWEDIEEDTDESILNYWTCQEKCWYVWYKIIKSCVSTLWANKSCEEWQHRISYELSKWTLFHCEVGAFHRHCRRQCVLFHRFLRFLQVCKVKKNMSLWMKTLWTSWNRFLGRAPINNEMIFTYYSCYNCYCGIWCIAVVFNPSHLNCWAYTELWYCE